MEFRPFKDLPPMQPQNPAVAPWYFDWIRHSTRDDFWRQFSIRDRYPSVRVPVLHFEGWYDAFVGGTENFAGMMATAPLQFARDNQRLVVGPWDHVNWGRPGSTPAPLLKDVGAVGDSPINDLMLAWFDQIPKGEGRATSQANLGSTISSWVPTPGSPRRVGLCRRHNGPRSISRGGAESTTARDNLQATPPDAEAPDTYTYDPAFPAPSLGGHSCCGAQSGPQGPYDQTPVEQRSDVLVYTTAPLGHDTEVTGPVTVQLWAQSTSADTDFTAKLTAVKPDGEVINLNDGILRTAFRDSLSDPTPTIPGRPYEYQIHIWPTSYEFRAGDLIRLEVSSSDYPQFAPNPNTGAPFGTDTTTQTATQTILHDKEHPSSVALPLIPG